MGGNTPTASSPSLKKLKCEAAQRRKAQARSLKLRADEQERLQRLEIDALVEQQRLQRLERQRCEELAATRAVLQEPPSTLGNSTMVSGGGTGNALQQHNTNYQQQSYDGKCKALPGGNIGSNNKSQQQLRQQHGFNSRLPDIENHQPPLHKSRSSGGSGGMKNNSVGGGGNAGSGGWRGGKDSQRNKHGHQHNMRAAVESRRRLARGPRSGVVAHAHPTLPSEDHRVVATEYQAAGTQALMQVTLLAAGFVIGARGISARLIGQVTGAIVQSWTESCRPDAVPIRLFRIQGKKAVVQAAVALIGQAVAKYKDLCDCKRRGEFVQREHIINGVEFYYQPPPRKTFAMVTASDLQLQQQQQKGCHNALNGSGGRPTSSNGHAVGSGIGGKVGHIHIGLGKESSETMSASIGIMSHASTPTGLMVGEQGAVATGAGGSGKGGGASVVGTSSPVAQLSYTTHHVWLQHLHAQQQQKHMQQQQLQENHQTETQHRHEMQQAANSTAAVVGAAGGCASLGMASSSVDNGQTGISAGGGSGVAIGRQQVGGLFFDWRSQQRQHTPPSPPQQQAGMGMGFELGVGGSSGVGLGRSAQPAQGQTSQVSGLSKYKGGEVPKVHQNRTLSGGSGEEGGRTALAMDSRCVTSSKIEQSDQGQQHSVSSLEHAIQHVRLQEQHHQRLLQHSRPGVRRTPEIISPRGFEDGGNGTTISIGGGVGSTSKCDKPRVGMITVNNILKQSHVQTLKQQQQQQLHLANNGLQVPSLWSEVGVVGHERAPGPGFQLGSSLFSIFGSGELPIPINSSNNGNYTSSIADGTSISTISSAAGVGGNAGRIGNSATSFHLQQKQQQNLSSTLQASSAPGSPTLGDPFDFPPCNILRESFKLDMFPFAPRVNVNAISNSNSPNVNCTNNCINGSVSEYSLYGHSSRNKNVGVIISDLGSTTAIGGSGEPSKLCIVCLEQPAGVRLMACGHALFCLACVQGLQDCPLCHEKIVGLHPSGLLITGSRPSSTSPAAALNTSIGGGGSGGGSGSTAIVSTSIHQRSRTALASAAKLGNGSSYHLWNWVPGASV